MDAGPAVASVAGNVAIMAARHALSSGTDSFTIYHPLTTLFWVALYTKCSEGTRFGFAERRICLEDPGLSQKMWRTFFSSEDREQLFSLNSPVKVACYLYDTKDPYLKFLFETAQKGFEQLNTYYTEKVSKPWPLIRREASVLTCKENIEGALKSEAPKAISETQKKVMDVWSKDDIITGVNLLRNGSAKARLALISFLEDREDAYINLGGQMLSGK